MKSIKVLFGLLFLLNLSAHASLVLDSQQTAVTPAAGGLYGTAVAMDASGTWMAVGQPGPTTTGTGLVEIYRYSAGAWTHVQTITASNAEAGDAFGTSVAFDGTASLTAGGRLVVGAPLEDGSAASTAAVPDNLAGSAGAAYVFDLNTTTGQWGQAAYIKASDAAGGSQFGFSVAMDQGRLVVGADARAAGATAAAGAVYVYDETTPGTWTEQAILTAPTPVAGADLGEVVAVSGDTIAASAYKDDAGATLAAGQVYVWVRDPVAGTWGLQATLAAQTPSTNARFGSALALEGDRLLIGAKWADPAAQVDAGEVEYWTRSAGTWTRQQVLAGAAAGDEFGTSVALQGSLMMAGAPASLIGTTSAGAAHVYALNATGTTWMQKAVIDAAAGSFNTAGDALGSSVATGAGWLVAGAPTVDVGLPAVASAGAAQIAQLADDISVTVTETLAPVNATDSVSFIIDVAVPAGATVTEIQLNTAETNLSGVTYSGACTAMPCVLANPAGGTTLTVNVSATVTAGGAYDLAASISTPYSVDPNTANNTANAGGTVNPAADVNTAVTLTTAGSINATGTVSYTVVVNNAGPDAASNVVVTPTFTNLTLVSASSTNCTTLPCTLSTLAVGASETITVTATVNNGGAFDLAINSNGTEFDPNGGNNSANAGGTANPAADVNTTVTLTTAGTVNATDTVSYTVVVNNAGPDAASNVVVTPTFTNLTLVSASSTNCTTLPCTLSTLAVGASETVTVTATVNNGGAFDLGINSTATEFDPNTVNNAANAGTAANPVADVSVAITLDTAGPYTGLQTVQYTITVSNAGPDAASNIALTLLPNRLTNVVLSGACTAEPCSVAALATGATATIVVTAQLPFSGWFGLDVSGAAATTDLVTVNNAAAATPLLAGPAYSVPALNAWGMVLMMLSMLLAGGWASQRQKCPR